MLLDYYGTLLGAVAIRRGYSDHFGMDHYEMNPVWQDSVTKVKPFNSRHLATTLGITIGAILLLEVADYPDSIARGFLGALIGGFAYLVGRHVSNILIFRYVASHRDEFSGKASMAHPAVLMMSAFQIANVLIPMAIVAAISMNAYVVGATIGVAGLVFSHAAWVRKARIAAAE
jgi:NAD/NADP transhydrogenase alpha subunit